MSKFIVILIITFLILRGIRTRIRPNGEVRKVFLDRYIPFLIFAALVLVAVGKMGSGATNNSIVDNFKRQIFNGFSVAGDGILTLFIALAGIAIMFGGLRRRTGNFVKWLVVIFIGLMAFAYIYS